MRQKQPYLVVGFDTTTDAMQMEKAGKKSEQLSGRLIPVPRQLSSGCGMAWREAPQNEEALQVLLAQEGIEFSGIYLLEL